jgi:hypothetical protein
VEMSAVRARSIRFAGLLAAAGLLATPVLMWTIVAPQLSGPGLHAHDGHLTTILTHLVGGSIMLLAGAIALGIGVARRWVRWHKAAGYTYLITGSAASLSGIVASFGTPHATGLSTFSLGLVWFAAAAMALRAVLNHRLDQHQAWMIRSYTVAWASIIFRVWTHLLPASWQFPPTDMLWTSWVLPLLITELILQWRAGARAPRPRGS